MKKKSLIVMVIILITGSFSIDISAQENIKALMKKCENMENVDISVARRRNPETRQISRIITDINFGNNKALLDEFIAAFNKDREMAERESENRSNGKITNLYCRFGNDSYTLSQADDGSASISVIEKKEDD